MIRRALRVLKVLFLAAVVVLIVASGGWTSWESTQHIVQGKGRERGTMTVAGCDGGACRGAFLPDGSAPGGPGTRVTIDEWLTHRRTGERIAVALEPGTHTVLRTGWSGALYAWVPLGGALLLASVVLAGGLRIRSLGWASGLLGAVVLIAAFVAL